MTLAKIGRHASAVQEFETAFRLSTQPADDLEWVRPEWANSLEALGRLDEAFDQQLTAISKGGRDLYGSGFLSAVLGKFAPSERDITQLQLRVDALDNADVYAEWASALEQLGDIDAAVLQYRKAAAKDPAIELVTAASRLLAKQGRHREAVLEYQGATEQHFADADAFEELLSSLRQVDEATRATLIESVQSWVDTADDAEARYQWGKVLLELGRPSDAEREQEASIARDPDNPHAQVAWGLALEADGKPALALSATPVLSVGAGESVSLAAALDGFKVAFRKAGSDEALAKANTAIQAIDGARVYRSMR